MNNINAMAGLLTYSPRPGLPIPINRNSGNEWALVTELTAAGQSGIYTRFPFNRGYYTANQKRDKSRRWVLEMQVVLVDLIDQLLYLRLMNFDATFDYGTLDLTKAENVVLWKFGELVKTLHTLASDAERQYEIIGVGAVAEEMADDFDTYFTLYYENYIEGGLLNEMQAAKLRRLGEFLKDRDDDFWDDPNLPINPYWELIRQHAKEILELLKMDDLILEFERKEKYDSTLGGKKLWIQNTKTRLVRKNL